MRHLYDNNRYNEVLLKVSLKMVKKKTLNLMGFDLTQFIRVKLF